MKKHLISAALLSASLLSSHGGEPPLLQSKVKGLLVITLPDGSHAGAATQMNATAVPSGSEKKFGIRFNQKVGPMMSSATREVEKLMRVKHSKKIPKGYNIEFGFANKHSLKDGPSAAVACALMANAIITGKPLDQGFAATGDLTATGEVRPIGGVAAKIRGAVTKDCTIFTVPKGNTEALNDLYITDGLDALCRIQIVAVKTFEEALAVATLEKTEEVQTALKDFEMVQKAVLRNKSNARHPKVVEKLKSILKAIPGHYSARIVALHGQGRGPKTLSIRSSLIAIEKAAVNFTSIIRSGNFSSSSGLDDPLRESASALQRIQKNVDPRTKPLLNAYIKLADFFKERRDRKRISDNERATLNAIITKLRSESAKIQNNKEIQEEMLKE